MTSEQIWLASAAILSFPALLIGGAALGSRLGPTRRWMIEAYVLLPLMVVLALVVAGLMILQRNWIALVLAAFNCAVCAERLVKHIRDNRPTIA